MALVEAEGVGRAVELLDGSRLTILEGVDLTIEAGERISIVGRSGSGKSTLLNLLGLLDAPTEGVLTFLGDDVRQLRSGARDRLRGREIGFVFQQFNLLQGRTAVENVQTPLLYSGDASFWRRARIARDMPTGALDLETGANVMSLIESVADDSGAALVTITHDPAIAARADRRLRLADGRLEPFDAATVDAATLGAAT
jgi:putative ABC transport system ATP-binding protein